MACQTCGSPLPCSCDDSNETMCFDNVSNSGCCNSQGAATPQPYFSNSPACAQDHTKKIYIQQFYADLKVASSWNVPLCDGSAVISVPGLKAINIGSYIWNATYGYFEVTAFNAATFEITVLNHCNDGNEPPGTNIPACTEFTVTDPPAPSVASSDVCVAVSFTAPDVDDCIDITLTKTDGIIPGYLIQIGTGFYRVTEIKPNSIITICNEGSGITPGTSVVATDVNDEFQYCLQIIAQSPCTADAVSNGNIVVCNDNITKPLKGCSQGGVPMLIDSSLGNVEYRPLDSTVPQCTALAQALSILSGTANYTLVVDSSVGFVNGDVVQIDNRVDRLTITNIPDGTHITGTMVPTPAANETVGLDTCVCEIGCCEKLGTRVDTLEGTVDDIFCEDALFNDDIIGNNALTTLGAAIIGDGTTGTVTEFISSQVDLSLDNFSTCRAMEVAINLVGRVDGNFDIDPLSDGFFTFIVELQQQLEAAAWVTLTILPTTFPVLAAVQSIQSVILPFSGTIPNVPASTSRAIHYRLRVTHVAGSSESFYNLTACYISVNVIGVSV